MLTYPARTLRRRGYPATGLAVNVWLGGLVAVVMVRAASYLIPHLPPLLAVVLMLTAGLLLLVGRLIALLGLALIILLALAERLDRTSTGTR
ncbi:hypothetical protein ACH4YO_41060 [Streptomyces noursei]|uniref:hypothetical protein n=1 Tax=Streptomyces noursei TaxID=1971 RepID=UPI0033CD6954